MARVQVLVQLDPELLGRADRFAAEWTAGNRSRLIADALEQVLARHAAHVASERRARVEPAPWQPGPAWSPDDAAGAASRPLTRDLQDL